MSNYGTPPAWAALTAYTQNQSEVVNSNYYYICTTSGVSGSSNPFTANTAASVFNDPITDGTCTWVCAQRARAAWTASKAYTAGLPLTTSASVTVATGTLRTVPNAQFIPIGAYVLMTPHTFAFPSPPSNTISGVNAAASIVTVVGSSTGSGSGQVLQINQAPYPYPDQIVTGSTGTSPVVQCIVSGVSGGSQPTWPTNLGASVTDGSAAWATVGFN